MVCQVKWALVTGAGRGVGRAISLALAKEGICLALCSRTKSQLEGVAKECTAAGAPNIEIYAVDLSKREEIDSLVEELLTLHQKVDILVNNAGIIVCGTALKGNPDEWEKLMAVNVLAPMRLTRKLAPAMKEGGGGTIINIGSVAGLETMGEYHAHGASKSALRGWSLSCSNNLGLHNIKVVLINPEYINTGMAKDPNLIYDRMLDPDDVAQASLLALHASPACVPQEITLRLTLSCMKD